MLEPPGPELVPADGDEEVPLEPEVVVLVPGVLEVVPELFFLLGAVITALCPPGAEELESLLPPETPGP